MSAWDLCGLRDSSGLTRNCEEPATRHYAVAGNGVAHYCVVHAPDPPHESWILLSEEEVLVRQVLHS